MHPSGRQANQMRAVAIERNVAMKAEGSCLVSFGNIKVLVTASVETTVPDWMHGKGQGWVTAEYGILPRATGSRNRCEATTGKQTGCIQEVQRLIGRSLRAVVDMQAPGEAQITLDCDVLEADGSTRIASITGAYVALADAVRWMKERKLTKGKVLRDLVAAVSCGIYRDAPMLDLDYLEDVEAHTDANFVMTSSGKFVKIQGAAKQASFSRDELNALITLAEQGIGDPSFLQQSVLSA
ncbi:MAG: ribonuclease PH [Candidatus Devosia symbiotica]|nr:ribonuclease PH [Candidatus Devosia symbiotica]